MRDRRPHLRQADEGYAIEFAEEDTKNRRRLSLDLLSARHGGESAATLHVVWSLPAP